MKKKSQSLHIKKIAGTSLIAVVLALTLCASANAQSAFTVTNFLDTGMQMIVKKFMTAMGLGVEGAVVESGAATRAEIAKAALVDKTVAEGLEARRQQQALNKLAIDTKESLVQPPTTCQTMAAESGIASANQNIKAKISISQAKTLKKIAGNTNTAKTIEDNHKATNANFCSQEEAVRGVCGRLGDEKLAGADQNAAFLFQSADGSASYEGGNDGAQAKAAQSYIDRVVVGIPLEQLRKTDYTKSPQGRAFTELVRRYSAMLSMSVYSLTQIKEAHNTQPGLGDATQMATVSVPGYAPGKSDMSMLEVVQRLVATKFSPTSMAGAAVAMSPNTILREMAQTSSFQLWIDHQTLLQDIRTESLMAHQLVLLTEQTLRPQLEAQRIAATRTSSAGQH